MTHEQLLGKISRLEACGADAIQALRICLCNPSLTDGQRAVAQEALDQMFREQPEWRAPAALAAIKS